jgi:[protein-PII] uridylyltransferase
MNLLRHAPHAPLLEAAALRRELTDIFDRSANAGEARPLVVERLKAVMREARAEARARLEADGNGRQCAISLAHLQDELIRVLYDYTITHVYRATNPSDAERMAIIATGGYGREMLAPGSDVDLLFLLPYKQTAWGESVAEHMLYLLWDLGLKVGHATRTVDQCIKAAAADITIRTALLDMWLIHGDEELYHHLERRFRSDVVAGTARAFIDAKMAERDERHRRIGESRYRVEPNVKDGKGGLRDLHTLHWMSRYLYGAGAGEATIAAGIFTPAEVATFRRCEDFLWTVRCHLHFLTGRAEERLTFDLQPALAGLLGYRGGAGLRPVERFMKHYFLVAKDVGDLTTILCAALEIQQLKAAPGLSRLVRPLSWRTRRTVRMRTEFRIDNDRINVADPEVFKRDPVNLIRYFATAESTGTYLHPDAIRLIRQSKLLIDERLRRDAEANRIFLEMLTGRTNPADTLRRMNETGVLGRFIPDFGKVVGMMQFNMYHHYTVDEHLIRTIGALSEVEVRAVGDELPLSTEIISTIENRRALYVAAFLHDIGKGRIEDHSKLGARISRRLCPRLGLTLEETELVAWLIEKHLTMSNIAQSRDISDPKTLRDFAAVVGTPERLKLLLLLTVIDIRAVGPGTWNGWKGQLLRSLYHQTMALLVSGKTRVERSVRVTETAARLKAELTEMTAAEVERFIDRQYPDYWLRTDPSRQAGHARLLASAELRGRKFAFDCRTNAFNAITELEVLAPNHPRLLSLFAGACAAAGANIVGAHISTTRDGLALDTFLLQREFQDDADESRRADRIGQTIERLLKGEVWFDTLLAKRRQAKGRALAFTVEPEVIINNTQSDKLTVLELAGLDRPGLLYELTSAISDLNLDIASAHITTFGEKAVDVFYVTDLTGKKIIHESRQKDIRARLTKALAGAASEPARHAR